MWARPQSHHPIAPVSRSATEVDHGAPLSDRRKIACVPVDEGWGIRGGPSKPRPNYFRHISPLLLCSRRHAGHRPAVRPQD